MTAMFFLVMKEFYDLQSFCLRKCRKAIKRLLLSIMVKELKKKKGLKTKANGRKKRRKRTVKKPKRATKFSLLREFQKSENIPIQTKTFMTNVKKHYLNDPRGTSDYIDNKLKLKRESDLKPTVVESPPGFLLDQIMDSQNKILAPSRLLKIRRDGTLEGTEKLEEYLARKSRK